MEGDRKDPEPLVDMLNVNAEGSRDASEGSEGGESPSSGIPASVSGGGAANTAEREKYIEKRRRRAAAKRRGPFIRDTATDLELPSRARSAAYRLLSEEVNDERISAHHHIEFRKYVDGLIEGVKDSPEAEKLHTDDKDLDDAVKGYLWWDLPRVEHWLKGHVQTWAKPLRDSQSARPLRRYCHVSSYGAKGTRAQMEDYFCTYLHWGNYFGGANVSSDIPLTEEDEWELEQKVRSNSLTQEEKDRTAQDWKGRHTSRLLGVFDGHGGMDCAAYARDRLPQEIVESEHFPHDVEQACVSSFKSINAQFMTRAHQAECDAGTTALLALIQNRKVYVASVGDCAAVIARKGEPGIRITRPHTASNPVEAAAVEQRGGTIRNLNGNLRVDGVVSVTRGLGCKPCSAHTSCIPEVTVLELSDQDEFLLLASDGLWDVMNAEQACDAVRNVRKELDENPVANSFYPYATLASRISAEAISLGSSDNVTVLVAFFDNDAFSSISTSDAK